MKTNCSNCGTQITLNLAAEVAEFTTAAHGRASKRVPARTVSNSLWIDSNGLVCWDAPCCNLNGDEVYSDSLEPWEYPALEAWIQEGTP